MTSIGMWYAYTRMSLDVFVPYVGVPDFQCLYVFVYAYMCVFMYVRMYHVSVCGCASVYETSGMCICAHLIIWNVHIYTSIMDLELYLFNDFLHHLFLLVAQLIVHACIYPCYSFAFWLVFIQILSTRVM